MERVAFLMPGQGAQEVGMGRDLRSSFVAARETFEEADEALGIALTRICDEGPAERLTETENAQPALLATSVAIARVLATEGGIRPCVAAGHSLGEWSALVVAGALDFRGALCAVRLRGRYMQEAVPVGQGAMAALLGVEAARVEALCRAASEGGEVVVPANWNGAGQVVVAGHARAVSRLEDLAGAERVRLRRLNVSAPFHSPLMAPAAERMRAVLAELAVRAPEIRVLSNVDGLVHGDAESIREACARAAAEASEVGVEVGPGRVLSGLMRRIDRGYRCLATGGAEGVRAVLAELGR